ncbi:hypothetical protein GBF38_004001 [Nibea albiflora]|uniref:Uncharacterized protein n=1 Tax=Nibea albiflora TaxID=240163 RepID=A0ACB7FC09_NIBAL|nr:hypothetical protein GBF38_004001 [Nibea albiflora]
MEGRGKESSPWTPPVVTLILSRSRVGWDNKTFTAIKCIKPLALRPVKVSEDEAVQELSRPHRSNSKEQLSEIIHACFPGGQAQMCSVQRFAQRKITFHACANVTRQVKRSENRQVVFTNENTPNRKPP